MVRQVRRLQREMLREHGAAIVHCSDEYYVTAGERVPAARHYNGYPQYENGIGMVRSMREDWRNVRRRFRAGRLDGLRPQRVVVASGRLAAPLLEPIAAELSGLSGSSIDVRPVTNTVFGERVNVTGLICGKDYVQQLRDSDADLFILPRPSLDYFGRKFLDSMTVDELQEGLGRPVGYASQWSEVIDILRDGPRRPERNEHSNGAFWSEERG
jgi:NifB/MoaA-like Fe-S oxidoreductase